MRTNTQAGIFTRYLPDSNTLYWDPFAAANIQDASGASAGVAPPILTLAHELYHAAHPGAFQEPPAIEAQNQIVAELNASYSQFNWNLPTNRGNENGE